MNSGPKILLILSPGFPASEADSTCLPSQQLFIKELNKNFPDLKIVILAFQYPFLKQEYIWHNNLVIPFNGRTKGKLKRLILWKRVLKKLGQLKNENDIIGILSFWCGECALLGARFGRKNKISHFSWILGQDAKKENKFAKWIKPKPDELIAMSDFLADEFYKNHFVFPAHVIPNGIDDTIFSNNSGRKDIDICGAGSLINLKRYDIFISVVKKIREQIPDIKAVLCGKGPEQTNLETLIKNYGLQKNISLTGERSHKNVLEIMGRSKIFLHTSSYEGFSSACLEALDAGAHVISFCKPMKEEIDHWHVVSSEDEMSNVTLKILQSPETCYEPVSPYLMRDSAMSIMLLFGLKKNVVHEQYSSEAY